MIKEICKEGDLHTELQEHMLFDAESLPKKIKLEDLLQSGDFKRKYYPDQFSNSIQFSNTQETPRTTWLNKKQVTKKHIRS